MGAKRALRAPSTCAYAQVSGHTATPTGPATSTVTRHPPPSGMERVPSPRGSCRKTSERVRYGNQRDRDFSSALPQDPYFLISAFSYFRNFQVRDRPCFARRN